jgi:hypothetical protein
MRVIDVSKPEKLQRITALSYGASRSGKTRFAGSWPRPLFLADATESGWTTLSNMDPAILFEAGRAPTVWAIEKVQDMFQAIKDSEPLLKRGDVHTIVIDSLTFYSDLFFNYAERVGGVKDPRQLYQKLAAHLKELREQVHLLGCNVVWLCLAKDPGEEQPVGGPMLSGQNAAKFAAGCDYVLYHRSHQQTSTSPLQWEIRTRKYQNYAAGGRDEGRLPDPVGYVTSTDEGKELFVPDCTFRTLAESLGIIQPVAVATAPVETVAPATASAPNGKGTTSSRPTPSSAAQPGRSTPR